MRVLVTGATGFAGSNFLRCLAASPDRADYEIIRAARADESADITGDLSEPGVAEKILRLFEPDAVLHFAGRVPRANLAASDNAFMRDNADATRELILAAENADKPPHIVFFSTAAVYPQGGILAQTPNNQHHRTRRAKPAAALPADQIATPYGRSKKLAEDAVVAYSGPWTVLRKPTVIGVGDKRGTFLHRLALHVLEQDLPSFDSLERVADYLHIEDVFDATMLSLTRSEARGEILNIGSCLATTGFQAWHTVLREAYRRGYDLAFVRPIEKDSRQAFPGTLLDCARTERVLGFAPMRSLEEMCALVFDDIMRQDKPQAYLRSLFPQP